MSRPYRAILRNAEGCFACMVPVEKDGKLIYIDHSGAVVWQEK